MSGGVKNVSVSNCLFSGTDVGLRFKSCRGRGGVVENIHIRDIYMFNIATETLLFDLYYGGKSASESLADGDSTPTQTTAPVVDETTPSFKDIYIKNITSRNARRAMFFNGLPEMNITNINVENAIITSEIGAEITESDGVKLKNIKIIPEKGPALILNNVKNMTVEDFIYPETLKEAVKIEGKDSKNIKLPDTIHKNIIADTSKRK